MMMIDGERQIGEPVDRVQARALVAMQANSPFTGCMSRFFQTSALTVGMTKNGEIISTRAMPRPGNSVCEQRGQHGAEADR